jgi:predicted nucleotidyltransferase
MFAQIRAAIADSLRPHPSVTSVWGFGSFFRGECYHDIDILVVVAVPEGRLLETARELRTALREVENAIGILVDPLILTEAEFEAQPLRDMRELIRI